MLSTSRETELEGEQKGEIRRKSKNVKVNAHMEGFKDEKRD